MNKIFLIGRLGSDPKFTVNKDGVSIAKFTVASDRRFKKEKTDWFTCSMFGPSSERFAKPFLTKGLQVCVIGEMQFNEYETKDGTKKVATNVKVEEIKILNSGKSATVDEETNVEASENETESIQPIPDQDLPF